MAPKNDPTVPDELPSAPSGPLSLLLLDQRGSSWCALPARATLTVGRDEGSDVRLEHPSVSRAHAVLEVSGERFVLRDVGSVNGVRVRGRRLGPGEAEVFGPGEFVEVGRASLVVLAASAPEGGRASANLAVLGDAVVRHPSMVRLYEVVARVAASDLSVLVLGETGVGKELLVEALHRSSPRAAKPLVRLNCASLSPTLIEAELFGHEKGAFTGATEARPGFLETADGGTLFLDEVGDLPLALQARLLRVLEDRQVLRVGARKARSVDVRFVAATHRELRVETAQGRFRHDLYHRLNGVSLVVPPLRERTEEVRPLAERFLAQAGRGPSIAPEALAALEAYPWPGNVRELRNVMSRAALLAGEGPITAASLPDELQKLGPAAPAASPALRSELEELERRRIEDALARAGGNQSRAAVLLGMPRRTLVTRLKQYGIARPGDGREKG